MFSDSTQCKASPIAALFALSLLAGCAALPENFGRSDIDILVMERGQRVDNDNENLLSSLHTEPLSAENAIRVALVKNPELRATYARLGFANADIYEASRIRNPVFSASILDPSRSGERDQLTFGLVTSFTDILTLSARKRLALAEFDVLTQEIGAAVLTTAADTQDAYYHYVASKQVAEMRQKTAEAAQLSFELATRYDNAGNLTPRQLALSKASAASARIEHLEATAEAYVQRTELASFLGISVGSTWDAPAQLPLPLEEEDSIDSLLALAKNSRLDLAAAQARVETLADRLGVTDWSRWLGDVDIGIERERETDGGKLTGPTLEWELPLFSQNKDISMRANAELQITIAELATLRTAIDNEVRLAVAATENAKARSDEYRNHLIPARTAATERAQEEENFMLIGIFELIETKQDEYDSYQGYLEAVRDYWLARTALTKAVGNTLPSARNIGKKHLEVKTLSAPSPMGNHKQMDHTTHGGMGAMEAPRSADDDPHKNHNMHQGGSK